MTRLLIALAIALQLMLMFGNVEARHTAVVFEDGSGRYADGSVFCIAGRICERE